MNQVSHPNPSCQADVKTVYTTKEIAALHIPISSEIGEPPEPSICPYCGQTLYHEGIVLWGAVICWNRIFHRDCTCKQAVEEQAHIEREQALKRKQQAETERRERTQSRIDKLLNESGIKKRYLTRTFDTYMVGNNPNQRNALVTAKDYAQGFEQYRQNGRGLYIEGTNGTGKTHLAIAIATVLIHKGIPVICKTSIDLLSDIKSAYERRDVSEKEILDCYRTVDLLIIDDLGKEQVTPWSISILYSILNDRYEEERPVIITTNYNEDMLLKRLTPDRGDSSNARAIISRLRECTKAVVMAWEDFRG